MKTTFEFLFDIYSLDPQLIDFGNEGEPHVALNNHDLNRDILDVIYSLDPQLIEF